MNWVNMCVVVMKSSVEVLGVWMILLSVLVELWVSLMKLLCVSMQFFGWLVDFEVQMRVVMLDLIVREWCCVIFLFVMEMFCVVRVLMVFRCSCYILWMRGRLLCILLIWVKCFGDLMIRVVVLEFFRIYWIWDGEFVLQIGIIIVLVQNRVKLMSVYLYVVCVRKLIFLLGWMLVEMKFFVSVIMVVWKLVVEMLCQLLFFGIENRV